MRSLHSYDYDGSVCFISTTKQITHHMDLFRKANKRAIDKNTAAVKDHAKRTEAVVTKHMLNQSAEAELTRTNFTTLFHMLIQTVTNIFSEDKGDGQVETFWQMVQRENDETQAEIEKHKNKVSSSITGSTDSLKTSLNSSLKKISDAIDEVTGKLDEINDGNIASIKGSLNTQLTKLDNIKTAIDGIEFNITHNHYGA